MVEIRNLILDSCRVVNLILGRTNSGINAKFGNYSKVLENTLFTRKYFKYRMKNSSICISTTIASEALKDKSISEVKKIDNSRKFSLFK